MNNESSDNQNVSAPLPPAASKNIPEKSCAVDDPSLSSHAPPAPILAKTIADMTQLSTYQRGQLLHWKELVHGSQPPAWEGDVAYAEKVRRHKQEREYRFAKRAVIRRLYRMAGCEPPRFSMTNTNTTTTNTNTISPTPQPATATTVKRKKRLAAATEGVKDTTTTTTTDAYKQLKTQQSKSTTTEQVTKPSSLLPPPPPKQEPLEQTTTTLKYMPIEKILPPKES